MNQANILLVDDDKNIAEILGFNLRSEGFSVHTAYSAEDALQLSIADFQLILLDVMMGGMSGYSFAEKIRKDFPQIPIIFLTAKDTENDMLTGFSVGGDDFITKPFSIKEVIARIKAVLKRSQKSSQAAAEIMSWGALTVDFNLKTVSIHQEPVNLTKTEFELLSLLAKKPETIFSRTMILDKVWKETPYITERTVDVHIARLRKKLGEYGSLITNRSGYGYRFNDEGL